MKKLFAILLAAAMLTCLLGGCGGTAASVSDSGTASKAETAAETQNSAPAAAAETEQPAEASNQEEIAEEEAAPGEMTQAEQLEAMQNLVIENPTPSRWWIRTPPLPCGAT